MADSVHFKFSLGDKVKCMVSGFTGIVDSRRQHLNGCIQYSVTSKLTNDGDIKGYYLDEHQLELIEAKAFKAPEVESAPGGPTTRSGPERSRS